MQNFWFPEIVTRASAHDFTVNIKFNLEIPYLLMVLLSIFFNKLPWPITRIIKSPAPSDETQQSVSVTYNEESAIEL